MGNNENVKDISAVYNNISHPASFSGLSKLRKHLGNHITNGDIIKYLREQESYTLHKPTTKKIKRDYVFVTKIDETWQMDLIDMQQYKSVNGGVRYILVVIDVLSKYVWARPLQDKKANTVKIALDSIITESGRKPELIQSDKGLEFKNKTLSTYLHSADVKLYSTENDDIKACIAERVIRTLKEKLFKYFTHTNACRYIDVLQDIIQSYNDAYHRSIGTTPASVNEDNFLNVWRRLYSNKLGIKKTLPALCVGAYVRISKTKRAFEKGYTGNWTKEIFQIRSVLHRNPPMYELTDLSLENITGRFYEKELQQVLLPEYHIVEKILRKRGTGSSKQLYVKWKGYPAKFNSWITETDLRK
jgi:Integrase core domain/Chromo (CHRromatin Organisation MOdifier) domain